MITQVKLNLNTKVTVDWLAAPADVNVQAARVQSENNLQAMVNELTPIFTQMLILFMDKISKQKQSMSGAPMPTQSVTKRPEHYVSPYMKDKEEGTTDEDA